MARTVAIDASGLAAEGVVVTRVDAVANWCRKNSVWPLPLGLACCAIEFMATAASRYDVARFGMEVMRFSPRQADLMIVAGWLSYKMAHVMTRLYDQMAEPKWVIAMGACASSGGMHRSYPVVQGIDEFLPVDLYIPGCPPRPEAVLNALVHLQQKVARDGAHAIGAPAAEGMPAGGSRDGRGRGEMSPPALFAMGERWYEGQKPRVVPGDGAPAARGYDSARGFLDRSGGPGLEIAETGRDRTPEREPRLVVDPGEWVRALEEKKAAGFDLLLDLTAVDYPDREPRFTLVAILGKSAPWEETIVETRVAEGRAVATLSRAYAAADWAEREVFDLFGIPFEGHPNLTRILLPPDFEGWPLRRDFPCEGHLKFRD